MSKKAPLATAPVSGRDLRRYLETQDDLMLDLLHRLEEQHREMIAVIERSAGGRPRPVT